MNGDPASHPISCLNCCLSASANSKSAEGTILRIASHPTTLHHPPPDKTAQHKTATMGVAFDYSPDRPENIDTILNGLDRYNPETTTIFQEYVAGQCESQTYDCYANLALLKL